MRKGDGKKGSVEGNGQRRPSLSVRIDRDAVKQAMAQASRSKAGQGDPGEESPASDTRPRQQPEPPGPAPAVRGGKPVEGRAPARSRSFIPAEQLVGEENRLDSASVPPMSAGAGFPARKSEPATGPVGMPDDGERAHAPSVTGRPSPWRASAEMGMGGADGGLQAEASAAIPDGNAADAHRPPAGGPEAGPARDFKGVDSGTIARQGFSPRAAAGSYAPSWRTTAATRVVESAARLGAAAKAGASGAEPRGKVEVRDAGNPGPAGGTDPRRAAGQAGGVTGGTAAGPTSPSGAAGGTRDAGPATSRGTRGELEPPADGVRAASAQPADARKGARSDGMAGRMRLGEEFPRRAPAAEPAGTSGPGDVPVKMSGHPAADGGEGAAPLRRQVASVRAGLSERSASSIRASVSRMMADATGAEDGAVGKAGGPGTGPEGKPASRAEAGAAARGAVAVSSPSRAGSPASPVQAVRPADVGTATREQAAASAAPRHDAGTADAATRPAAVVESAQSPAGTTASRPAAGKAAGIARHMPWRGRVSSPGSGFRPGKAGAGKAGADAGLPVEGAGSPKPKIGGVKAKVAVAASLALLAVGGGSLGFAVGSASRPQSEPATAEPEPVASAGPVEPISPLKLMPLRRSVVSAVCALGKGHSIGITAKLADESGKPVPEAKPGESVEFSLYGEDGSLLGRRKAKVDPDGGVSLVIEGGPGYTVYDVFSFAVTDVNGHAPVKTATAAENAAALHEERVAVYEKEEAARRQWLSEVAYSWTSVDTWDHTTANEDGSLSYWDDGYANNEPWYIAHDYGPYGPPILNMGIGVRLEIDGFFFVTEGYYDVPSKETTSQMVRETVGVDKMILQTCHGTEYSRIVWGVPDEPPYPFPTKEELHSVGID